MIRWKVVIEYDGTDFKGWQIQKGERTVQGTLEESMKKLLQRELRITGSGRTDAGVHAEEQVAHIDITGDEANLLKRSLNAVLPSDISMVSISEMDGAFHARFSAIARCYRYRVILEKHPLLGRYAFIYGNRRIDLSAMKTAAELSLGKSSWKGMAKEGSGNRTWNVNVHETILEEDLFGWTFLIRADRFLRGMVRLWAGTLLEIGAGKLPPETISKILETDDRSLTGPSLPACGLCLVRVYYENV